MKKIVLSLILAVLCVTAQAQLTAPARPRAVEYYVRGGYVMSHTSPLASIAGALENDSAFSHPGVSLVGGFRAALGPGWYGGMEYGIITSRSSRKYELLNYNTIFDEEKKYYQCEDVTRTYSFQFTPLMVGYCYRLLDWLAVDLHAGLNFHYSPFATRLTTMDYEDNHQQASGMLDWDQYDHFGYCLQYGFGLYAGHVNLDVAMRGMNGAVVSVGYAF